MRRFSLGPQTALVLEQGDITRSDADAIVNAANERMLGGGGVDGAIHRAAGPGLREACEAVAEVRPGVRCPTGEARITPGFDLKARWVIHTVGPVYRGAASAAPLASCYRSCLRLAAEHGIGTIAFPAISCGVYGYPRGEAAEISLRSCREVLAAAPELREIRFVLFGDEPYAAWLQAAEALVR